MPWIVSFILSWILFFLLIDFKQLKTNIWGGIVALILASFVDWGGQKLGLYEFHDLIIPWFGCSAFYKFGPVFVIGILFAQYLPRKKKLQGLNIIVQSILFLCLENLIIRTGTAEYVRWHILASLTADLLAFSSLTWFTIAFLKKEAY
ncbi:hypothetical protein [Sporosalibacterium faouarense]|uniref:hypothetical protein n=1 Tax=Sporosalibacterium faouarense TaxID=516123 RepID=UPI00192B9474|nr:hypothetical protein [Sporosalibacterium faouarense]